MENKKFYFSSFKNAFRGIGLVFREPNFLIQLTIGIIAVAAGFLFQISHNEWLALIIVSGIVLAAECFNTSIENLCDVIQPEKDKKIRMIKDISAGAVLITAIGAAATGVLIFLPKIIDLL